MPGKWTEREATLKESAERKKRSGKKVDTGAYVYGTMRNKMGWKPRKRKSYRTSSRISKR